MDRQRAEARVFPDADFVNEMANRQVMVWGIAETVERQELSALAAALGIQWAWIRKASLPR